MNERLDELTKQIQDAVAEIKAMISVISVSMNTDQGLRFLLLDERDIADNFPGYFRVPMEESMNYKSEVYATSGGAKFYTYSEIKVPAGVERICVASPERMAV